MYPGHAHAVVCVITTVQWVLYSLLNVHRLLKMDFCQYKCKGNLRHIHKYQADPIYWILRFIGIQIYCYRLFVLFHAYTQVDIVRAEGRCFKPFSSACERLLFILWEINRFLEVLFEFAYFKTLCFSILDPRFSHLETRTSRHSRRENRVSRIESRLSTYIWPVLYIKTIFPSWWFSLFSSRVCLTLYWYCKENLNMTIPQSWRLFS